ncbi:unnamed protein product [Moneuplotes crassus]|uniref:Uncharacterized protein n=1 Tax=Euplotes crassus TaxID=5936 RepID=A0AAD1UJF8_EUPCR|nr:unnamed protein product [Moneuplotes crassus]
MSMKNRTAVVYIKNKDLRPVNRVNYDTLDLSENLGNLLKPSEHDFGYKESLKYDDKKKNKGWSVFLDVINKYPKAEHVNKTVEECKQIKDTSRDIHRRKRKSSKRKSKVGRLAARLKNKKNSKNFTIKKVSFENPPVSSNQSSVANSPRISPSGSSKVPVVDLFNPSRNDQTLNKIREEKVGLEETPKKILRERASFSSRRQRLRIYKKNYKPSASQDFGKTGYRSVFHAISNRNNWFIHKGKVQKLSSSVRKLRRKIKNSHCFPIIKAQYARFIQSSRQTSKRKNSSISWGQKPPVINGNMGRIVEMALSTIVCLKNKEISKIDLSKLVLFPEFTKPSAKYPESIYTKLKSLQDQGWDETLRVQCKEQLEEIINI